MIAAPAASSALAAKAATTTIPIVFASPKTRSAWSCRQPRPAGRQCDRRQFSIAELGAKHLGLLRELVPGAIVRPAYQSDAFLKRSR